MGLHQEDQRIDGVLQRKPYIDFGLAVLKMDADQGSSLVVYKDYAVCRNTDVELILEPGQYIVVPRTTGCTLRRPLYAEPDEIKLMDTQGNLNPLFVATITDIFSKFDLLGTQTVDFKEFKGFLEIFGKTLKDENDFKATILAKFNSYEGAITLRGFRDWWKQQLLMEGEASIW